MLRNKKQNNTNSRQEFDKESVKDVGISINQIISITYQTLVVGCVVVLTFWITPFMTDYYQKMANSHYDSLNWFVTGSVFVVALFFLIRSFAKKKYFIGVITVIIAIWAFYWTFLAGPFYCQHCTYGG